MYKAIIAQYAVRLLKKFVPRIKNLIIAEFGNIAKNPYSAAQLTGKNSFLRSWHVYIEGVPYRILFQIDESAKTVIIRLFGKRDDIYKIIDKLF